MPARKLYATTRLTLRGNIYQPGAELPPLGVVRSESGFHQDALGRVFIEDTAGRPWRVVSGGGRTGTATAELDGRYEPNRDVAGEMVARGLATTDAAEAAALRRAVAAEAA